MRHATACGALEICPFFFSSRAFGLFLDLAHVVSINFKRSNLAEKKTQRRMGETNMTSRSAVNESKRVCTDIDNPPELLSRQFASPRWRRKLLEQDATVVEVKRREKRLSYARVLLKGVFLSVVDAVLVLPTRRRFACISCSSYSNFMHSKEQAGDHAHCGRTLQ
jgi:hypothetical protein